jgi:CRP-like cAMP-binding protein
LANSRLLGMLRPELAALIIERAERVKLTHGEVLFHAREPAQFVYFPTDCLVSMVVSLETGNSVEAATVGNDGYVGISAFLGMGHEDLMGMAQIPGETLRLPVEEFRRCLEDDGFRAVMGASTAKTLATISQSIACNTFHAVNQRLARWLLLVRDATERHEFPLTHEFIAIMLGVHRGDRPPRDGGADRTQARADPDRRAGSTGRGSLRVLQAVELEPRGPRLS